MENKQEQIKKIISKAADLEKGKEIAMAKELLDINEKQEETLQAIKDIPEAEPFPTKMRVQLEGIDVITINGRDGHTPTEDELQSLIKPLIPEPIKGDSYILTKKDKVEISRLVKVPIVEKIETVREIPMITNEVIEVAVSDEPIIIKEKLESLKDEERLDISAIKGVEKSNNTLSDNIINRAIGIVDQRTSFLINKVSNLSAQVSAGGGGGGVTSLNTLTGAVTLSAGSNITLTPSGNDIEIASTGGGGGSGWALTGNAGTTAGTNFIGTTDAQDLIFKVNTQEKLRLFNTGASNTDVSMTLGQITSGELTIKFREDQNETFALVSSKSGTDMTTTISTFAAGMSIMDFVAGNGTSGFVRFSPQTAVEIRNRLPLRFWDSGNNYYAGFRAGGSMASDITWTLPSTDSTGTQALVSNGSGVLSWATPSIGDVTLTGTETLTNKRITPRVVTVSNATTFRPNSDDADVSYQANTQATGTLTILADLGTPTNGQMWIMKLKSTNVQTFSWDSSFLGGSGAYALALPTTSTGGGKVDYYGFIFDDVSSKWHLLAASSGY